MIRELAPPSEAYAELLSSVRDPLIRIVNADRAMLALLREWLGAAGYRVAGDDAAESTGARAHLTIVDVPFTRHGAVELLQRIAKDRPGIPILALSATFFSNVSCAGDCARALGVAGVLPKPLVREALLAAVDRILGRAA